MPKYVARLFASPRTDDRLTERSDRHGLLASEHHTHRLREQMPPSAPARAKTLDGIRRKTMATKAVAYEEFTATGHQLDAASSPRRHATRDQQNKRRNANPTVSILFRYDEARRNDGDEVARIEQEEGADDSPPPHLQPHRHASKGATSLAHLREGHNRDRSADREGLIGIDEVGVPSATLPWSTGQRIS